MSGETAIRDCEVGVGGRSPISVIHFGGSATFYFIECQKGKKEKPSALDVTQEEWFYPQGLEARSTA